MTLNPRPSSLQVLDLTSLVSPRGSNRPLGESEPVVEKLSKPTTLLDQEPTIQLAGSPDLLQSILWLLELEQI